MKTGEVYLLQDPHTLEGIFILHASKDFVRYYWMNDPEESEIKSAEDFESFIDEGLIKKYG